MLDDIAVNFRRLEGLLAGEVEFRQLVHQLGIVRVALPHRLQREGRTVRQAERVEGLEQAVVEFAIVRILLEFRLDQVHRRGGILLDRAGNLHPGAAGLDSEDGRSLLRSTGDDALAFSQDLAAVQKGRCILEHRQQQLDGIAMVVRLDRAKGFEPQGPHVRRQFCFGNLGHGAKLSGFSERAGILRLPARQNESRIAALASTGIGNLRQQDRLFKGNAAGDPPAACH
jgi:hypothetical protein